MRVGQASPGPWDTSQTQYKSAAQTGPTHPRSPLYETCPKVPAPLPTVPWVPSMHMVWARPSVLFLPMA